MEEVGLSEPECPRLILGSCEKCPVKRNNQAECWKLYEEVI